MEYKSVPSFTKDVDGRVVVGLASITGNLDDGGDVIMAGAFTKTIQERARRVRHLWQHDFWEPPTAHILGLQEVGRDALPDAVLEKYPDATGGLEVKREYLQTDRGSEILAGLESGAINEMSIGFDPVKGKVDFEEIDGGFTVRVFRELRLWDTSDVNWGMNPATVAVKNGIPPYLVELAALSRDLLDDERGAALKDRFKTGDIERLHGVLAELEKILTAEPSAAKEDGPPTLTDWASMQQRLAIAERQSALYETE